MKYKVYAIQGVQYSEIEIEADSKERAQEIYEALWRRRARLRRVGEGKDLRNVRRL